MLPLVVMIACLLLGFGLGKASNGMTSPRKAFDLYTGPTCAVVGVVISIVGYFFGADTFWHGLLVGSFFGLVAGLAGLGVARGKGYFARH